jgi:HK97 family phage major capsid protein
MFLEEIGSKPVPIASARGAGDIDMSEKEAAGYSIIRAINACMSTDRDPWKGAGFEREISQEIGKRASKDTAGFFMPSTLPMYSGSKDAARAIMEGQRSTSSTAYGATINATQGGANLVATNLLTGSFIDVLRNKTRVMQMGATMLSGLVGNVQIPRQTSGTATYWLSPEGVDVTEAEVIFDSITMTPRTIGARSQITRQMLLQATPDIEMLVRNDLSAVMALGIDAGALNGTGASGQPTGIFNKAGINSVAMGTNGLALANLDPLVQLETLVANANVDDNNMAYLTNSRVIGAMKLLKDSTGRYMWTDNQTAGDWGQRGTSPLPASVNGYPIFRTNQVSNTFTKGTSGAVCSGAVFGNWSDLIIGEWGVLEILPNPYGAGFNNGSIDIRTLQSVDINVRHPLSFGVISDILAG